MHHSLLLRFGKSLPSPLADALDQFERLEQAPVVQQVGGHLRLTTPFPLSILSNRWLPRLVLPRWFAPKCCPPGIFG